MGKLTAVLFLALTMLTLPSWANDPRRGGGLDRSDLGLGGGLNMGGSSSSIPLTGSDASVLPSAPATGSMNSPDVCGMNDFQGYTGCFSEPKQEGEPENSGDKGNAQNKDDKKNGDSKSSDGESEAAAKAAACRSEFQSVLNSCDSAISTTTNSCDSNQSGALQSTASQVSQNSENESDSSDVNRSCIQANKTAEAAKSAMTSFRQQCSGALNSCVSSCQQVSNFLQSRADCYGALGFANASAAQNLANTKASSCDSFQARVAEADRAISSYGNTAQASTACNIASNGGVSEASGKTAAQVGTSAFCQTNPTAPGCGASIAGGSDCSSDPSSLVCVCSKNPNDSRCGGTSQGGDSFHQASIDSSSRVKNEQANLGGDVNIPSGDNEPRAVRSSDVQGIDGRQGGEAVGNANLSGAGALPEKGAPPPAEDPSFLAMLAAYFAGGGGNGGSAGSGVIDSAIAAVLPSGARAPASAKGADKAGPDLRQFLPGGISNPFNSKIAGSAVGQDGITGPHSDIWKKIRNRYQVLQGTFEP